MFRRAVALCRPIRIKWQTLLLGLLVASLGLGIYVERVWRQRRAASAIRDLGGMVAYDYQLVGDLISDSGNSWVPVSLRHRLGDDFFHSVVYVQIDYRSDGRPKDESAAVNDDFLSGLGEFPALESVELNFGPQSDEGLRLIGRLRHLKHLNLLNSGNLTDEGVAHFSDLDSLESICLNGTKITDESIRLLGELPRLTNLDVRNNELTNQCLQYAGQMQPLRMLWVGTGKRLNPAITDEGLMHLLRLSQLEGIDLEGTAVSEVG